MSSARTGAAQRLSSAPRPQASVRTQTSMTTRPTMRGPCAQNRSPSAATPYKKGDLPQALAILRTRRPEICATCSAPWRDKALVFDAQHRGPDAAEAADRAIALNPRSGPRFPVRGVNKARAGRTEQALLDYDEAIRLRRPWVLPIAPGPTPTQSWADSTQPPPTQPSRRRSSRGAIPPVECGRHGPASGEAPGGTGAGR